MAIVQYLLILLPFLFYVIVSLKKNINYQIQPISLLTSISLLFLMSILFILTPIEEGNDKYYYMLEFLGDTQDRDNEIGWVIYNSLFRYLLGGFIVLFFWFGALIYLSSYFLLAKKLFSMEYVGYFIIMAAGSLGFAAYGCNTIRAGIAISFLFLAYSLSSKMVIRLALVFCALLIHKTMILPVVAFLCSYHIRNRHFVELFWIFCLLFSVLNLDLGFLFDKISSYDQRVEDYSSSIGSDSDYGSRFRWDFLIYSVVPIYIANLWMNRYHYFNAFYLLVYRSYVFTNAIWLLVIRIAYSDRIAYLSWFLIPIIVLFPLLSGELHIKKAQRYLKIIMGVFIGLNVLLCMR